jgi:Protein of unknown function (DUF2637)
MSDQPAARLPEFTAADRAEAHRGLRITALIAVAVGVLLLAAAAFVLSYAGIHAIALKSGVSARLARFYPLIFDAMLVVAGAAVLALRGAGLITRCYTWLIMLLLLAAVAGADALHATGTAIPHRPAAATVAIVPWALVLISFGLLIAMLRHARQRRTGGPARSRARGSGATAVPRVAPHGQARSHWQPGPGAQPGTMPQPEAARPAPVQPAPVAPAAAATAPATEPEAGPEAAGHYQQPYPEDTGGEGAEGAELAMDAEDYQDDPTSDEASAGGTDSGGFWLTGEPGAGEPADADGEDDTDGQPESPGMPPFDRMWSPPTPPGT